jgi:hypothetical protein
LSVPVLNDLPVGVVEVHIAVVGGELGHHSFAEEQGRKFAEELGHHSFAEELGRYSFAEEQGHHSFAEGQGRKFAEEPEHRSFVEERYS